MVQNNRNMAMDFCLLNCAKKMLLLKTIKAVKNQRNVLFERRFREGKNYPLIEVNAMSSSRDIAWKGVLSTQGSLRMNLVGRWFYQRNVLFERRF
jgi:hypothetical protein